MSQGSAAGRNTAHRRRLWTLLVGLLMLALLAGSAVLGWSRYQAFLQRTLDIPAGGQVLLVDPGMTGQAVVAHLDAAGLTRSDWRWRVLMRLEPVVIRAGEYQLEPGMTPPKLLALLASGDVIRYGFTIVEGWTYRQLVDALQAEPRLGAGLDDSIIGAWLATLEPGVEHPEGWFLPETYVYTRGDDALDVLGWAYRAMRRALADAWATRDTGLPLETPYELLILASIIEKETAVPAERGEIAGVFARRLQQGMRLQTDPTVIYGLGDSFDGDIRRRDLRTDTPYNTYTRHGLPPTPIALPGRDSLVAAAQPAAGETLYFVADGQGGHTFSASLEEHQRAVDKLIKRK